MTTKAKLIAILEKNRGSYLSGEEIAAALHVSRAAIWKAMQGLREEGYGIDAVKNRGYCLREETDKLSAPGIQKYLGEAGEALRIETFQNIGSTNTLLRERANTGEAEGLVLVAAEQTAGRGRFGRSFFSPPDTGLYISLLLRPALPIEQSILITGAAAVAMCRAIETCTGETPGIKWVNDVYLHGKKVCGILTEAGISLESGSLDYVVVGLGVNLYAPQDGFPGALGDSAGYLLQTRRQDRRNCLAAAFLNEFMGYHKALAADEFLVDYKQRSLALGKRVTVLKPEGPKPAMALDLDDRLRLFVRYPDGHEEYLSSGEISIRL